MFGNTHIIVVHIVRKSSLLSGLVKFVRCLDLFKRQAMMDRLVAFTEQISKGTADVRVTQWLGRPEV